MKKVIISLAVLPVLVACNSGQDILTPFRAGQEVSITSQPINDYERGNVRKVHVREEVNAESGEVCTGDELFVTRLLWDAGDQIDVFVDDDVQYHEGRAYPQSVFTLVSGANTSEGTFSGTMPAAGTKYALMYPHRDAGTAATKTIVEDNTEGQTMPYIVSQFYMPAVQTYRSPAGNTFNSQNWPTFASELLPIFGKGDLDNGFETYPCGGVMRFKLWSDKEGGESVKSIRLAANNNENLTGTFTITPTSGTVEMNMTPKAGGSGRHAVVLTMPNGFTMPTTQADAVWIYFVLPAPLTFNDGFDIYTYDVEITNPGAPSALPTHAFVIKGVKPQIKQNHITTINFGDTDEKGNNGNINGGGWEP